MGPGSRPGRQVCCLKRESEKRFQEARMTRSARAAVAGVLGQVAVRSLLADVVLLVVAMALGGVEGNGGRAAGALVALVVVGNGRDGFGGRLRHACASPLFTEKDNARDGRVVPHLVMPGLVPGIHVFAA